MYKAFNPFFQLNKDSEIRQVGDGSGYFFANFVPFGHRLPWIIL